MKDVVKLKELTVFDILILAIIMFATAIYSSTYDFIVNFSSGLNANTIDFDITDDDKIRLICEEILFAFIALCYLKFRNFDFSRWQFKISFKDTLFAILMFCIPAFFMDIFFNIVYFLESFLTENLQSAEEENYALPLKVNVLAILSSLVNGSFEELFFIAICLSVSRQNLRKILILSLLVRISFHTYQGVYSALGIGLILGLFYFFVYEKLGYKNLYAFFLSHAIADVFGLGLMNFFYFELI